MSHPQYGRGMQRMAAIHGLRGDRDRAQEAPRRLVEFGQPPNRETFLRGPQVAGLPLPT